MLDSAIKGGYPANMPKLACLRDRWTVYCAIFYELFLGNLEKAYSLGRKLGESPY